MGREVQLAQIPVATTKLSIGMYVAMLDRPWLETPFVFQGFEIKDRVEIQQLQDYCSHVFVDIDKGTMSAAQVRALAACGTLRPAIRAASSGGSRKKGWMYWIAARLGLADVLDARAGASDPDVYPIKATVRSEAPTARKAYDDCADCHARIVTQARARGVFDLQALQEITGPLIDSILRNPDAMAWTVFTGKRSSRKYSRAVATAVWSVMFGRHLGFERSALDKLAIGGLLLDIGNVELPDEIVQAEGAITLDQYREVPQHVAAGIRLVHQSGGADTSVLDMIRFHHERFDGSGYPAACGGSEIPVYGRISGIADCYDAMTTRSSYSPALAAYDAARELNNMRNKQFHAEVVDQFLYTIGMFPTGSVVELSNGFLGLVLEQNRSNPLRPKVLVVQRSKGSKLEKPEVVNMQDLPTEGEGNVWIAQGHEHGAFGVDPLDYFN